MEEYKKEFDDLEKQIQKIYGMLDFEKADEFEKKIEKIKSDFYSNIEELGQIQKYKTTEEIATLNAEIWGYMQQKGNAKSTELNRTQNLRKLKELIANANKKESEQILLELKQFINEIKHTSSSESDIWQLNEMVSEFLLIIYIKQAKNKETIDLGIIRELSIDKDFINTIQKELRKIAKGKDENEAYDIMLIAGNLNEENINNLELWQILTGMEQVAVIEQEPSEIVENDNKKELRVIEEDNNIKFLDKILKRTTKYVFRELNEETGEYEIKVEYHRFPPKGNLLKRCKKDLIELEINDVSIVKLSKWKKILSNYMEYNMYDFENLEVLVFGKNVHKICRENFAYNTDMPKLRKIICGDDVQQIEKNVFFELKNLTEVVIGSGMNSLGEHCFKRCKKLSNLEIKEGLQEIGSGAFSECIGLQDMYLPKSLIRIGIYAFDKSGLKSVELPNTNINIGNSCFKYCEFLEKVAIQEDKAKKELVIPKSCFESCNNLKEIPVLEYTKKIGESAFACTGIEKLYIPDNITDIGKEAFAHCHKLEEAIIGEGINKIPADLFEFCEKLQKITHKGVIKDRYKTIKECIKQADKKTSEIWQNSLQSQSQDASQAPQEGVEH